MSNKQLVIAIDGPAASGKSTTARLVADRLGYTYIDTGAMYRAATLAVLRHGIDPADRQAVEDLAANISIVLDRSAPSLPARTLLNGEDVSDAIRSPEVTAHVSAVSAYPGVRQHLVAMQKQMGSRGGVVLDGRDIGTVVFPDADLKIFMVADVSARADRRTKELVGRGESVSVDNVADDLQRRDHLDSSRDVSPLRQADDAILLDNSSMTIDQQVDRVLELARERMGDR